MSDDRVQTLPRWLGGLIGRLPQWPHSAALAAGLNLGLAKHLDRQSLESLRGKTIRLVVRDAGASATLRWDGTRFEPCSATTAADVTIAAAAQDYWLLALRREDPDTLFFARRLAMDGDTEAGLVVKNMLDAVDTAPLLARLEGAAARLRRLREILPRPPLPR